MGNFSSRISWFPLRTKVMKYTKPPSPITMLNGKVLINLIPHCFQKLTFFFVQANNHPWFYSEDMSGNPRPLSLA